MANIDSPFGLRVKKDANNRSYNFGVRPYYIPATDNNAMFIGDAVTKTTTANSAVVKSGNTVHAIGTLMTVAKTTVGDGNAITGVIVAFEPDLDNRSRTHRVASTERVALVCDDPMALFEIQADGTLPVTSVGLNAVLISTHAGSAVTGLSGLELDTTSDVPAADASNQLTIVSIGTEDGRNDASSANVVAVVRINQHTEHTGEIGIA